MFVFPATIKLDLVGKMYKILKITSKRRGDFMRAMSGGTREADMVAGQRPRYQHILLPVALEVVVLGNSLEMLIRHSLKSCIRYCVVSREPQSHLHLSFCLSHSISFA